MTTAWLCQIDARTRVGGVATSVRLASHDDDRLCHLDGQVWWPAIARLPTFGLDFFDGAFGGDVVTPTGSVEVATLSVPGFRQLMFPDARIRWWRGQLGAAWATFTLEFDGLVINQPAVAFSSANIGFRVDDRWLDEPLLATYAGTTGAEGDAALKGQVKPLLLGAPRMAEGVLINAVDSIVQLNDGPMEGVDVAMESAERFPASVGDYANYAALQGATIAPAFYATSLAAGLVRHGAPPDGVLTYDVRGSNSGADGGGFVRRTGAIVKRLAARAGQSAKVDAAALDALDVARPWNVSIGLMAQTSMREVAQALAQSINAVALVTWTGKLTILPIPVPEDATPVGTLAADGSALPPVGRVDQLEISSPWWRLAIEAEVTNRVHGADEIRFMAQLIDRGRYDVAESYREGHIVDLADGSRWLYIAVTPTIGNDPPVWPVTSNAFWTNLTPPIATGKMFVQVAPPSAAESAPNDKWVDNSGRYWTRREDIRLSIAGVPLSIGDDEITLVWTPNPTQPILTTAEAVAVLARDAQATADGKINSFYLPTAPIDPGLGDLWYDTANGNHPYRWNGSIWQDAKDGGIATALDAAIAASDKADGKVTTFITEFPPPTNPTPVAEGNGDLWYIESTGEMRRWNATAATWGDSIVDLTAATVPRQEGPSTDSFTADYQGTLDAEQLPRSYIFKRYRGPTDVSAASPWAIVSQTGISGGTVTVVDGVVTIPTGVTLAGTSTIVVKSTRPGDPDMVSELKITRVDALPPSSGGGGSGTSVSDSSFASFETTTFVDVSDVLTVKTGSGGNIALSAPLQFRPLAVAPAGDFYVALLWRYRAVGGSWTDVAPGAETASSPAEVQYEPPYLAYSGFVSCARSLSGLTASADYEVKLMARQTSGTTRTFYLSGKASAVGS